jgi:hypothetical protein
MLQHKLTVGSQYNDHRRNRQKKNKATGGNYTRLRDYRRQLAQGKGPEQ